MIGVGVGQSGNDLHIGVVLLQEIEETGDRGNRHFGIERLLIAHGSVGAVCKTDGRLADGRRVKGRGLECQGGGVRDDLGIQTAHDARDRNGGVVVADHEGVFVDSALHAVEGLEHKRLGKALDADLADLAGVEGVHRLTHFEHEVVGEVGEEVDASHAAVEQADAHINRADTAADILDLQAGIALTERILDFHIDLRERVVGVQIGGVERFQLSARESRELARDAVVTPEVGTVGEGLVVDLKNDILDRVEVFQVGAVGGVVGDVHDARVVVADADFRLGAAHAVGHHARERTRRDLDFSDFRAHLGKRGFHTDSDIRRAADHVGQLRLADIHLQKMELLGVGMVLYRFDLGDNNAAEIGAFIKNLVLNLGG